MATIKFWQEMRKATSVDGQDKVMIGKNSNGEAMYVDFQYLINQAGMNSSDYIPIDGNTLPTLGTENKFSIVGSGTYTQSGGSDIVVDDNTLAVLSWDGSVWTLGQVVEMPDDSAKIEEWTAGTYEQNEVVTVDGMIYRALEITNEEPPGDKWESIGGTAAYSVLQQNTGNPVNSDAVLTHLHDSRDVDFKGVDPVYVIEDSVLLIGNTYSSSTDYDVEFYRIEDLLFVSNNLPSGVGIDERTMYFFSHNLISSNTRINNFFEIGLTGRKRFSRDQAISLNINNRLFAINRHKSYNTSPVEVEWKYGVNLKGKLIPNLLKGYSSAYVAKILTGKNFSGNNIVDSPDTDIYIVEIENDVLGSFTPPADFRVGVMGFDFNVLNTIKFFGDGDTHLNRYPLYRSVFKTAGRVKYIAIPVKSDSASIYFETEIESSNKPLYRRITQSQAILSSQGESIVDRVFNSDGSLGEEPNSVAYIFEKNKLPKATITLKLTSGYNYLYLLDSEKNVKSTLSGTGTYDVEELDCDYFAFTYKLGTNSVFTLDYFDGRGKFKEYDLVDYLSEPVSIGIDGNLSRLIEHVHAEGGGIINIPAGVFDIYNPIIGMSNVSIRGAGDELTIFRPYNIGAAFRGDNIGNFTYSDFQIDGINQKQHPTQAHQMKGIFQTFLTDVTYKNLIIRNTGATGLGSDFFQSGLIHNVRAYNCGRLVNLNNPSAPGSSGIGIGTGKFNLGNEGLVISSCHTHGNGQYGIFVETQPTGGAGFPVGTVISNCTSEKNRVGFGCSGGDSVLFVACQSFGNHQSNFAYDNGTLGGSSAFGKRPKYIGCISKSAGRFIPVGYPEYQGNKNGYGWYIEGNFEGIELTNCDSSDSLRSGLFVKEGIKDIYINGGSFYSNDEDGIELVGIVNRFKISPSKVSGNGNDGVSINGNMSNGFLKDFISTENKVGVNKKSGNLDNVIVKDILSYDNYEGNFENINLG